MRNILCIITQCYGQVIFRDVLVGSCWRQKKYDEDENVPPNVPPIYDILVSEGNAGEGLASFALENNSWHYAHSLFGEWAFIFTASRDPLGGGFDP